MADNETTADIIAEMRGADNKCQLATKDGTGCYHCPFGSAASNCVFDNYADRLDAAHKRERGNAAKLREAVIGLRDRISMFYKNEWIPYDEWEGANDDANSALAAPARNCDVYTADELKAIFKSELDSQLPIANEHEKNLVTITATGVIDTLFATTQKGGNDAD